LRALNASPLTVPLNPVGATGVAGTAGCVGVAVAGVVGFAVAVAVELFVGVAAGAAGLAVVPAADGVAAGVAGVAAPPPRSMPPGNPMVPTELLKAGGVIDRTAPSPVTVPAAMRNTFFIAALSPLYLRGF